MFGMKAIFSFLSCADKDRKEKIDTKIKVSSYFISVRYYKSIVILLVCVGTKCHSSHQIGRI